jgi:hypothetical protein
MTATANATPIRLGLVLPSVNTVVEPWLPRSFPPNTTVHFARMLLSDQLSPENVKKNGSGGRPQGRSPSCELPADSDRLRLLRF